MSEWISVKDGMPADYQFVLIICMTDTDEPASYSLARWEVDQWNIIGNGESVWNDLYWGIDFDEEITHWMPLPPLPQQKKGKDNDISINWAKGERD